MLDTRHSSLERIPWHKSKTLAVPEGITILFLPPYNPELNPVENLWYYLRSHYLSNRAYEDYDALLEAGTTAYRRPTPECLKTTCACPHLECAYESRSVLGSFRRRVIDIDQTHYYS